MAQDTQFLQDNLVFLFQPTPFFKFSVHTITIFFHIFFLKFTVKYRAMTVADTHDDK